MTHEGGKITCQRNENLTEWFTNDSRSLEQGWTIHSREKERGTGVPPVSSNLTLTLALRGDLSPQVSPDSSSVSFQTASGGTALTYGGLKAWDADGTNLTVRFEPAGEDAIRIAVEDQSARYPITIDPIAQQAYLKASNTGAGDNFAGPVAVSGDTVVVGAPLEDSNATGVDGDQTNNSTSGAGAAYIFTRSGTTWTQQAYLKASNTDTRDAFGEKVAVSGDTVVVGVQREDSNATGVNGDQTNNSASAAGAAYVFVRTGTTWTQQAYLKASNTGASDGFGYSVAVSSDTVVAGAWGEDSNAAGVNGNQIDNSVNYAGAAYIFDLNTVVAAPEISIEYSFTALASGETKTFQPAIIGSTSDLTFEIRNFGNSDLILTGTPKIAVTGSGDFTVTAQPTSPISGPAGGTLFSVRFAPTSLGPQSITLSIPSNDADESPFILHLSGTGMTPTQLFYYEMADQELTGANAEPDSIPFGDGVNNLLKYAFNLNLMGPDSGTLTPGTGTSGLPAIGLTGTGSATMIRVEFLRRIGSGLIYTPKRSNTLAPGSFSPMTGTPVVTPIPFTNDQWERVVIEEPADPSVTPRAFVTVEVNLP